MASWATGTSGSCATRGCHWSTVPQSSFGKAGHTLNDHQVQNNFKNEGDHRHKFNYFFKQYNAPNTHARWFAQNISLHNCSLLTAVSQTQNLTNTHVLKQEKRIRRTIKVVSWLSWKGEKEYGCDPGWGDGIGAVKGASCEHPVTDLISVSSFVFTSFSYSRSGRLWVDWEHWNNHTDTPHLRSILTNNQVADWTKAQ